jgi:hypothetical protein
MPFMQPTWSGDMVGCCVVSNFFVFVQTENAFKMSICGSGKYIDKCFKMGKFILQILETRNKRTMVLFVLWCVCVTPDTRRFEIGRSGINDHVIYCINTKPFPKKVFS